MPPGTAVLSVEFKLNLLAPATGEHFRGVGRVVRAGRTLSVCSGELRAVQSTREVIVALMQGTMMTVRDREGLTD
jgi:acyl-coenzyme A thioesterase PaaI-like protein